MSFPYTNRLIYQLQRIDLILNKSSRVTWQFGFGTNDLINFLHHFWSQLLCDGECFEVLLDLMFFGGTEQDGADSFVFEAPGDRQTSDRGLQFLSLCELHQFLSDRDPFRFVGTKCLCEPFIALLSHP